MAKAPTLTPEDLAPLGASESNVRWLTKPSAKNIQYLDLIESPSRQSSGRMSARPGAVIEFEGQPLLYVADNRSLVGEVGFRRDEISQTLRLLACRGDPAYFAILEHGQVIIHPIGLNAPEVSDGVAWNFALMGQRSLVQDLAVGVVAGLPERDVRHAAVHDLLYRLLAHATDQMLETRALRKQHDDVLALMGRAFFTRFLIDRHIMTPATYPTLKGREVEECFATPRIAAATCEWLDKEFNGDLLPLADARYKTFFESLGKDRDTVLQILSHIMHRAPGGQLTFDSRWGDLDFAHIPIGLLSEVYERFAHRHIGKKAASESMHYTPRHIAEFMIEEAFEGLDREKRHRARLLDPAAGAGVFLTLGLRKLAAEHWEFHRRRPSRKEIRKLLYDQIRGFDINPSALKLAALGLYLTAIELDPNPTQHVRRSFRPLFALAKDADLKTVLTCARLPDEPESNPYVLGSLGPAIDRRHDKRYSILISNVPWTAHSRKAGATDIVDKYRHVVRDVARVRAKKNGQHPGLLAVAESYENPDGVPDLPFIWRSMEWVKSGGIIALALHGRLLFKQTDMGRKARDAVFTGLRVTGILNGAAVRTENVWPNVAAPWCLLFARNEVPQNHHVFHFVSVEREKQLNTTGRIRIDHKHAQPIQFSVLREKPYLLKTLFRGTAMDAAVMDHLASQPTVRLGNFVTSSGLSSGKGYQIRERGGDPNDSRPMIGMPDLNRNWAPKFGVNADTLTQRFNRRTLHRPRNIEIYRGPLTIIPESIPERPDQGCGLISLGDVAYTESYTGYSTFGFKDGSPEILARYFHVLTYSKLFQFHALMSSAKFGVERDTIQKEDVDDFPIIPFANLNPTTLDRLQALSEAIANDQSPWHEVDALVFELYGIPNDLQSVVTDTLSVSLPYTATTDRAERPPSQKEIETFCSTLESHLRPLFEYAEINLRVEHRPRTEGSWAFLDVICGDH